MIPNFWKLKCKKLIIKCKIFVIEFVNPIIDDIIFLIVIQTHITSFFLVLELFIQCKIIIMAHVLPNVTYLHA